MIEIEECPGVGPEGYFKPLEGQRVTRPQSSPWRLGGLQKPQGRRQLPEPAKKSGWKERVSLE